MDNLGLTTPYRVCTGCLKYVSWFRINHHSRDMYRMPSMCINIGAQPPFIISYVQNVWRLYIDMRRSLTIKLHLINFDTPGYNRPKHTTRVCRMQYFVHENIISSERWWPVGRQNVGWYQLYPSLSVAVLMPFSYLMKKLIISALMLYIRCILFLSLKYNLYCIILLVLLFEWVIVV